MGWGSVGGAALSLGGSIYGAHAASRARGRRVDAIRGYGTGLIYGGGYGHTPQNQSVVGKFSQYFGQQEAGLRKRQDILSEGWRAAMKETERMHGIGQQRILERGRAREGALEQDVTSRGLSGTTVRQSLLKGHEEDLTRRLAEHDQRYAQMRAQQHVGAAQSAAQAEGDLVTHYRLAYNTWNRDVINRMWDIQVGVDYGPSAVQVAGAGDFSGLYGLGSQIGSWIGGGGLSNLFGGGGGGWAPGTQGPLPSGAPIGS